MKIRFLTFLLIGFTLFMPYDLYVEKKVLDITDDTCNRLSPMNVSDMIAMSDFESELWGNCLVQEQIYSTRYLLKLFATTIFIVLIILSWKIDNLKKHKYN